MYVDATLSLNTETSAEIILQMCTGSRRNIRAICIDIVEGHRSTALEPQEEPADTLPLVNRPWRICRT
jgi:hypothetical protein